MYSVRPETFNRFLFIKRPFNNLFEFFRDILMVFSVRKLEGLEMLAQLNASINHPRFRCGRL